jgi:hypothetical protein
VCEDSSENKINVIRRKLEEKIKIFKYQFKATISELVFKNP